jgi:excisionase family DNA binding protein
MCAKKKPAQAVTDTALQPRLLTIKSAAQYLGATIWAVRSLCWNHALPYLKIGHRILLDVADLDAFIETQKTEVAS